jgi:peroxiredoxin
MVSVLLASSALLWVIALFNLILTFALVRRINKFAEENQPNAGKSLAGQKAPYFTAGTLSGQQVTLDTYQGNSTVFLFIGPSCPPCVERLPYYQTLAPKARLSGVDFVLVSNSYKEETKIFSEENDIDLPLLVAPHSETTFLQDYQAISTPSFTYIDQNGIIQFDGYPGANAQPWQELVDSWGQLEI